MLRTEFYEHKVIYVPRSSNKPAHELAALGLAGAPSYHQMWVEIAPDVVSRALYGDSTVQV